MPRTLLLADDSVTIQRVVELAFANEDVDVVTVGDGARAIEAIERDEPDIVLADVSMPGKDGYEVASFVRSDPARARIPVVLLTGAFEPLDEARCGAIGRHEVLVKPFEPRQMIGRVRELLELPAAGAPAAPSAAAEALAADRADAPAHAVPDPPLTDATGASAAVSDASSSRDGGAAVSDVPAAAGVDASSSRADDVAPPADVPDSSVSSAGASSASSDPLAGSDAETASGRVEPPAGQEVPGTPARVPPAAPPPAAPSPAAPPPADPDGLRLSKPDPPPRVPPANPGGSVLAQAFATFLAVEQGAAPPAPPAADSGAAGPRPEVTDALLDELAERVAARLTETVLRDTVAEVVSRIAGRLVREEGEPVPPAGG